MHRGKRKVKYRLSSKIERHLEKKRKDDYYALHRNSSKSPMLYNVLLLCHAITRALPQTLLFFPQRLALNSRHFSISPVCSNNTLFFVLSPVCSRGALVFPFSETKFLYVVHTQTIIPALLFNVAVPEIF